MRGLTRATWSVFVHSTFTSNELSRRMSSRPSCIPAALYGLASDAFAGHLCERVSEIPESMRVEYWRRRWIQLARQDSCAPEEFAEGMLIEDAN